VNSPDTIAAFEKINMPKFFPILPWIDREDLLRFLREQAGCYRARDAASGGEAVPTLMG
jgi:hypothetical protein